MTGIHEAALTGDVESVREALARGEDVNAVSADGETPLHVACTYAHDECVAALLAAGARTDAPDATGTTALHLTCLLGHASTLRLLVVPAAGHLNLRGPDGGTPLHVCCTYGHAEAADVMLAAGADVCATDGAGSTGALLSPPPRGSLLPCTDPVPACAFSAQLCMPPWVAPTWPWLRPC